ncbi:MAG: RNA polymerase sigma factor SigJ [Myxococcota bacterium]
MTDAADFEAEREAMIRLAYRMLGSVADAEDVVQDAYVRWHRAGRPELASPRAWLVRTCTRLCLDRLKSAQRQREAYVGQWLPEPIVEPIDRAEVDETLSMALMLTIDRLAPAQRAAFLLHDVFGYEFREIAEILSLQEAHCRQLARRARQKLRAEPRKPEGDGDTVRRVTRAFFDAIETGDLDALQAVLAADVVLRSDGGGKAAAVAYPMEGATAVSRFFQRVFLKKPRPFDVQSAWFNGAPGVLLREEGTIVSAFQFLVVEGAICGIFVQRNPDKLAVFERDRVHHHLPPRS